MKKLFGTLMTFGIIVLCIALFPISAKAANSWQTAVPASFNATTAGSISKTDTQDWYKFTIPSSGTVICTFRTEFLHCNCRLYDSAVTEISIAGGGAIWADGVTNVGNKTFNLNLKPGDYYIAIIGDSQASDVYYGNYNMGLTFVPAEESFPETAGGINNTIQTASVVIPGKDFKGHIGLNDKVDYFEFSSKKTQTVKVNFASCVVGYANLQLYKKDGAKVGGNAFHYSEGSVNQKTYNLDVEAGTYVIMVENGYNCEGGVYTINVSTSEGNKAGFAEVNGGMFFESYGEVLKAVNGLVQDPDNKDDWYFCANGQVQTKVTSLVQYPAKTDNWFYVQNGKLDTTYNGKVSYNGGEFFVARGKILREKTGLMQDPNNKNDWYFLVNGQVQKKKTGIAKYNGAGFYVINGKLASDYTGKVTDNGVTYNVVKGRVV